MTIELSNKNGNGAKQQKFYKKEYPDAREAESNADRGKELTNVGGITI